MRTRSVTGSPRSVVRGALTNTSGIAVGAGDGVGVVGTGACGYTVGAGAKPAACGCFVPAVFPRAADGDPCVARPTIVPINTIDPPATAAANRSLRLKRGSQRRSSDDTHNARWCRARVKPLELERALRE